MNSFLLHTDVVAQELDTVSDTASKDANADRSGPTIRDLLLEQGYPVNYLEIVPDEVNAIQQLVQTWSVSGDVDWIITTGGTGFGVRDATPEVCPVVISVITQVETIN